METISEPLKWSRGAGADLLCDPRFSRVALRQVREIALLEALAGHSFGDDSQGCRFAVLADVAIVVVLPPGASLAEEFIGLVEQPVAEGLSSVVPAATQI